MFWRGHRPGGLRKKPTPSKGSECPMWHHKELIARTLWKAHTLWKREASGRRKGFSAQFTQIDQWLIHWLTDSPIHWAKNRVETVSHVTIWPLSASALAAGPGWARRAAAGSRGSGWGDAPRSQASRSDETLQTQRRGSPAGPENNADKKGHEGTIGMDLDLNWNTAEPLPEHTHKRLTRIKHILMFPELEAQPCTFFPPVSDEVEGFLGGFLLYFMGTHGNKIKVLTDQCGAFLWLACVMSSDSKCWSCGRGTMRGGFGRDWKYMCNICKPRTDGAMRPFTSCRGIIFKVFHDFIKAFCFWEVELFKIFCFYPTRNAPNANWQRTAGIWTPGGNKRTQIKVVMLRQRGWGTMQKGANDGSHQGVTVSHYDGSFLHALRRHEHILSVLRGEESLCVTQLLLQSGFVWPNISAHDDCTHLLLA